MNLRQTVDIRIISTKDLADDYLHAITETMKRKNWKLVEQPSFYPSRKQLDEVRIYTKWIKQE